MAGGQKEEKQGIVWWTEPEKRLRVLVSMLAVLTALFIVTAFNSPEGSRWLVAWQAKKQAWERARQFQKALEKDPKEGLPLANFPALAAVAGQTEAPVLVIVFGGCEGCGAKFLDEWAEVLGNWQTWQRTLKGILVIREKEGKVREVVTKNGWEVPVVADEDGTVSKGLNAFFSPRAYGFVGNKLAWVQKEPKMGVVGVLESFLKVVHGDKKAAKLLNLWSAEMRERLWGIAAKVKKGRGKR